MTLAKKCDRCGKYFELKDSRQIDWPTIRYRNHEKRSIIEGDVNYDICPECQTSFERWMKGDAPDVIYRQMPTEKIIGTDGECPQIMEDISNAFSNSPEITRTHIKPQHVTRYIGYAKEYGKINIEVRIPDKEELNEND